MLYSFENCCMIISDLWLVFISWQKVWCKWHFLKVTITLWSIGGIWRQMHVMPRVRVPKTERIRHPQQCKSIKGFYCQLEPGLPSHPAQWSLDESPQPRVTVVFISLEQRQGIGKGWLAAGVSWYLLIGQSSLWLARVTIPGSMTQGLFLA